MTSRSMKTKLQAKIPPLLAGSEEPSQLRPESNTMSISKYSLTMEEVSGIQWVRSPEPKISPSKNDAKNCFYYEWTLRPGFVSF